MSLPSFYTNSKFVRELSPKDFQEKDINRIKSKDCSAVLFYCPWCGHCKALKKDWEKLGEMVTFMKIYAFDCQKYSQHFDKINMMFPGFIQGYPTIVFYKGEKVSKYSGSREASSILKELNKFCKTK